MSSSYRIFKRYVFILTVILFGIIFMFVQADNAFADENSPIQMIVESGFNNEFKATSFIPLTVTVTNNGQEDIEGTILINVNSNNATYYKDIILPKNTTKSVILNVPGQGIGPDTKVKFYHNDKLLADTNVGGVNYSPNTLFVGVLASDVSTGNFLYTIPKNQINNPINIAHISNYDSFNSLNSLMLLDVLIINNFSFDNFNQDQIDNIIKWTEQGGSLILAGGSHYTKIDQNLTDLSPVEVNDIKQIDNLSGLENKVGTSINIQNPFTVSDATVKNGDVLVSQNDLPLFVLNEYSQGKVLYVAYDINEDPLASWSGNKELWADIINELELQAIVDEKAYQVNNNWWALYNAASMIPSLEIPELNKLIILFIVYLLIIGPVLYFILRKKDKRGRAWYIIPLTAIIIAVAIYQFSSINKGKDILVNNVSVLELDESQNSRLLTASSLFAPKAGDYKVKYNNINYYQPINNYNYRPTTGSTDILVSLEQNNVDLTYQNMDYWSYRTSYIETSIINTGSFTSDLHFEGNKIVGTITNNSKYNFRDIKVLAGSNIEDVGDLNINESKEISINYDVNNLINSPRGLNIDNLLPNNLAYSQDRYNSRERYILDYLNNGMNLVLNYDLTLIGWTEEELIDYELDNNHIDYNLTLVKCNLEVKPNNEGFISYIPNNIKPKLISHTSDYSSTAEGYFFGNGSFVFEFDLEELSDINLEKIKFIFWSYEGYSFGRQIYNWTTENYESFSNVMEKNNTLQSENIDDYLSENKKIRIMLNNDSYNRVHLGTPAILIEGWMEQ